jgi:hypothetical protein
METNATKPKRKVRSKSKVSELDEKTANVSSGAAFSLTTADCVKQKRRAQGRLAQRVSRRRKDQTLAFLEQQVRDLQNTVDGATASFLNLTGDIAASGWLEYDTQTAKAVKESIQSYISLMRASQVLNEDQTAETPPPRGEIAEENNENSSGTSLLLRHSMDERSPTPGYEGVFTASESISGGLHQRSFLFESISIHTSQSGNTSLPRCVFNGKPLSFAQQLHMKAFQHAFTVIRAAREQRQDFQRVFNCNPNHQIQEAFSQYVTKVLTENSGGLLEPPAEPEPIPLARTYFGWLNATQVMLYFREHGVDLTKPAKFAYLEIGCKNRADGFFEDQRFQVSNSLVVVQICHEKPFLGHC